VLINSISIEFFSSRHPGPKGRLKHKTGIEIKQGPKTNARQKATDQLRPFFLRRPLRRLWKVEMAHGTSAYLIPADKNKNKEKEARARGGRKQKKK
jgi:hypothetical protein